MLDLEEWPFSMPLNSLHTSAARRPNRSQASPRSSPASKRRATRVVATETLSENPMRGVLKRRRALEDIEGDDTSSTQRKKRRLRHSFSTSRLSEPYAIPTTYIASRKALREGIWARQKVAGRNLLRKAAALNSFSKRKRDSQVASRRLRSNDNNIAAR